MGVEPKLRPLLICRGQPGLDTNRIRYWRDSNPQSRTHEVRCSTYWHTAANSKSIWLIKLYLNPGPEHPGALVVVTAASLETPTLWILQGIRW